MAPEVDFNFSYFTSTSLPLAAASRHSVEMMQFLFDNFNVDANAWADGRFRLDRKIHALIPVILKGKKGIVELMLKKSANPNYGNYSPWRLYCNDLKKASTEVVKLFIKNGATLDMKVTGYADTSPLGKAIEDKRPDIAKLLIEGGANPNYCSYTPLRFRTPLYWAVKRDDYESTKLLLENGADVNNVSYNECKVTSSETALENAVENKRDQRIIDLLLKNGAR